MCNVQRPLQWTYFVDIKDFTAKEQLMSITDFLKGIRAIGNDDICESVAAGLQVK